MEFLNYHHLRYFWAVAKEGGLRKAADKLRVSQPTISAQIAALEAMLGEKLFRRGGRALTLTEEGHRVLSYAEEIFSLGHELLDAVKQRPTGRALRIQIGVTDSLPKLLSYEIIKPIFSLAQSAHANCREGKAADLLAQLAAYHLDLVLADEPAPSSLNIKAFNHLLGECGLTFCAAPKLAARLKCKFPKSLNDAPALLPATNTVLRSSLEKWFMAEGIRPRVMVECEDAALMKTMATDGLGFIAVPTLVSNETVTRYGIRILGRTEDCRQQFYAISAERKASHPAVLAITSCRLGCLCGSPSPTARSPSPRMASPNSAPH
ncbi:MAG: LysR family transcriptional regulator [Verrucomicrobia bacterium]|nr:LysR family transcriptional regulator [Verrucomicrobiota bacterium]